MTSSQPASPRSAARRRSLRILGIVAIFAVIAYLGAGATRAIIVVHGMEAL